MASLAQVKFLQVAVPYLKRRFLPGWIAVGQPLPYEMCRQGWAFVYRQQGAEYGDLTLEDYNRVEKEAQCVALVRP